MKRVLVVLLLLFAIACAPVEKPVEEVKVDLYPPKPEMEPPLYEPLEDAPDGVLRVFKIDIMQTGFTPDDITVDRGDRVKLLVTALDFDHDFRMPDFGIAQEVPKMQEMEFMIDADELGEFEYQCAKFCDPRSVGVLRVQ